MTGTSRGSVGTREQHIDAGAEVEDRATHAHALRTASGGGFQTTA